MVATRTLLLALTASLATAEATQHRRAVDELNEEATAEAHQRDDTATREFSNIPIMTSDGRCLFVDPLSGDLRANLTPVQVADCRSTDGQNWDVITAGKHNDQDGAMLIVSTLTQACLNFDDRNGNVNLFSCGGRAAGEGAVSTSQLFDHTGGWGPHAFTPRNVDGQCLAVQGDAVVAAACNDSDPAQSFTFGGMKIIKSRHHRGKKTRGGQGTQAGQGARASQGGLRGALGRLAGGNANGNGQTGRNRGGNRNGGGNGAGNGGGNNGGNGNGNGGGAVAPPGAPAPIFSTIVPDGQGGQPTATATATASSAVPEPTQDNGNGNNNGGGNRGGNGNGGGAVNPPGAPAPIFSTINPDDEVAESTVVVTVTITSDAPEPTQDNGNGNGNNGGGNRGGNRGGNGNGNGGGAANPPGAPAPIFSTIVSDGQEGQPASSSAAAAAPTNVSNGNGNTGNTGGNAGGNRAGNGNGNGNNRGGNRGGNGNGGGAAAPPGAPAPIFSTIVPDGQNGQPAASSVAAQPSCNTNGGGNGNGNIVAPPKTDIARPTRSVAPPAETSTSIVAPPAETAAPTPVNPPGAPAPIFSTIDAGAKLKARGFYGAHFGGNFGGRFGGNKGGNQGGGGGGGQATPEPAVTTAEAAAPAETDVEIPAIGEPVRTPVEAPIEAPLETPTESAPIDEPATNPGAEQPAPVLSTIADEDSEQAAPTPADPAVEEPAPVLSTVVDEPATSAVEEPAATSAIAQPTAGTGTGNGRGGRGRGGRGGRGRKTRTAVGGGAEAPVATPTAVIPPVDGAASSAVDETAAQDTAAATAVSSAAPAATSVAPVDEGNVPGNPTGAVPVSRAGGTLNPTAAAEAHRFDSGATRPVQYISLRTSSGQCATVDPTAGDFRQNLIPIGLARCDGSANQKFDFITAGRNNDGSIADGVLITSVLTNGCVSTDARRAADDNVTIFSCGGRAGGEGGTDSGQIVKMDVEAQQFEWQVANGNGQRCVVPGNGKLVLGACGGEAATFTVISVGPDAK